jgi:cell division protein FtsN
MATKRKPAKRSKQGGSTLYGVLAGLLLGLAAAAGVAFYVTRAPMPFVDKATRQPDQSPLPDVRNAPNPNAALYGRDGPAGTAPTGPTATEPSAAANVAPGAGGTSGATAGKPDEKPDELGALIASLPSKQEAATAPPPPAAPAAAHKPAVSSSNSPAHAASHPGAATNTAPASGTYFLQAGAYRVQEDAESLKARIIMLGLPASVQRAEVNNMQINRVRVGPFARLDDMNRARSRLGENKIESAVVRQ